MLSKFLDPKNDFAFKKIFGTEKNKDILIHFLNDILEFKGKKKIRSVEFLSPVQNPEIAYKKQSLVDVLCRDKKGVQFIVEMQVTQTTGFEKRAQYYAAKAYSQQAVAGGQYETLKEIIFIAIADCIIFPNKTAYKSDHVIFDKESQAHDLKDFSFTFIELPKFSKTKPEELQTLVEKWCYFFKYAPYTRPDDFEKIISNAPILKRAYEALDRFYWTDQELFTYDRELKRINDELSILNYRLNTIKNQGREEGLQEGRAEGRQVGREEGRQEGRQEGERCKAMAIAKTMLAEQLKLQLIKKLTGLSDQDLYELENEKITL
jgi:predicted transposase/invertase (TIGR01784 family)